MTVRAHYIVHGTVQGVFYRASALTQALCFGLTGWVQNRGDGTVEIVCEGAPADVKSFQDWCERGPVGAHVSHVDAREEAASGEFSAFSIR